MKIQNLMILLAFAGCAVAAETKPLVIGHRGDSAHAPENTVASAKSAWQKKADGVEGDYYLTRDGKLVCIHDADTKRTTGVAMKVRKANLAELQALDAGAIKGSEWKGERIPTLNEILDTAPPGGRFYLEIKAGHDPGPGGKGKGPEYGPDIVGPMKTVLDGYHFAPQQIVIISFSDHAVAEAKRLMPEHKAYLLVSYGKHKGQWTPTVDQIISRLRACHADGLDTQANMHVITPAFVKAICDAGFELHCWVVDDPKLARRLRDLGMDSITTNRPGEIREALESAAPAGAAQ